MQLAALFACHLTHTQQHKIQFSEPKCQGPKWLYHIYTTPQLQKTYTHITLSQQSNHSRQPQIRKTFSTYQPTQHFLHRTIYTVEAILHYQQMERMEAGKRTVCVCVPGDKWESETKTLPSIKQYYSCLLQSVQGIPGEFTQQCHEEGAEWSTRHVMSA